MTAPFGWSDTVYATVATCFSCGTTATSSTDSLNNYYPQNTTANAKNKNWNCSAPGSSSIPSPSSSLPEGLRPFLLNDSSTDDEYSDALSLHSNVGGPGRGKGNRPGSRRSLDGPASVSIETNNNSKTKKKKKKKTRRHNDGWFTLFGYNLFGKRETGRIQLPLTDDEEDGDEGDGREDDEDDRHDTRGATRNGRVGKLNRTRSAVTLDSDAAPLDDAAIAAAALGHHTHISGIDTPNARIVVVEPDVEELAAAQRATKNAEREERRRRRRERKALERALSLGLSLDSCGGGGIGDVGGGKFEGFQGSGDGASSASIVALKSPPSERVSSYQSSGGGEEERIDEEADFGASVYVRDARGGSGAIVASESGSSRTTSSYHRRRHPHPNSHTRSSDPSNTNTADSQFHKDNNNNNNMVAPVVNRGSSTSSKEEARKKTKTTKSHSSRMKPNPLASSSSGSAASSSQSPSLSSPTGSTTLGPGLSQSLRASSSTNGTRSRIGENNNNNNNNVTKMRTTNLDGLGIVAAGEEDHLALAFGLGNNRGFPSTGFGRIGNSNGAFLARRGD